MGVCHVPARWHDHHEEARQVVTIFYYITGVVFGFYVLGVITVVYENHYKPHKYWKSLQEVRKIVDEDIELIAAKKRHPAGKRRG